jgi:hypothetical protein
MGAKMKRLIVLMLISCPVFAQMDAAKMLLMFSGGNKYLLRDEFNIPLAAGSVNGTLSTSGHLRTVTDTENKLSITGGNLSFSGGKASPAIGDPGIWYPGLTRVSGLTEIWSFTFLANDKDTYLGWDANQGGGMTANLNFYIYGTFFNNSGTAVGSYSASSYKSALVLRTVGDFKFLKGGTYSNWTLLWFGNVTTGSTMYPCWSNNTATLTADFLRIPQTLWLPVPLASDGFGTAFGTTDGAGHAEGVTGGLGSGGGGVGWTSRKGSFAVTSAKAVGDTTGSLVGSAISTVDVGTASTLTSADLVRANGSVGIIVRYIDSTNYICGRHDGTNAQLVRVTNGTATNLITAVATYSASATIRVISDGNSLSLFYNNARIGAVATETQGLTSTLVGVCNAGNTSNTIDNLTAYSRGVEGQYSILNKWSGVKP